MSICLSGLFRYRRGTKENKKIAKLKKQILSILKDCLKNDPEPTVIPTVATTTTPTVATTTTPTVTTTVTPTVNPTHPPVGGKYSIFC